MKRHASLLVLALGLLAAPAALAAPPATVADVIAGNARVDFIPRVAAAGFVLTVSGPDGNVERQEFDSGRAVLVTVSGPDGKTRPDGVYTYELRAKRAAPAPPSGTPSGLETADGRSVETDASVRSQTVPESAPLTGSFWIQNGQILGGNTLEPRASRAASNGVSAARTSAAGRTALDVVTADDAIIQGSACMGIDCLNNEVFGFHTIRLKENNTRIGFVDTSLAGFPTNDWMIQANSNAGGGASYLGFVDQGAAGGESGADTGTLIFQVTAGAPANSLLVDSSGRVGFRTATPALDLHVNTSDTPALRLDQNNSGGFTAQTWDVAGNEANFFVRDVTGGSRLPFRIFPGAPTSSLVIAANGNVGIGMTSPAGALDLNTAAGVQMNYYFGQGGTRRWRWVVNDADPNLYMWDQTAAAYRFTFASGTGYIGIGTTAPTSPLHMASGAICTVGGVWTNASSREYKQNIQALSSEAAEETLAQLSPVTYAYKVAPGEHHVGFIAEDVPEIVATTDRKGLSPMDIVGVLTKVVQEQQKTIRDLSERLLRVEASAK